MKKIAAILLFSLYLFNLLGYKLVFNYAQQQADYSMESSLDRQEYNEADLLTITVPLSLPYQNNEADFKRVDGEITVNGILYKYVKRKVADGNLVLLCLPDHNKMRIQSAKDEFFKYANDLVQNNHSKKSNHSKTFKSTLGEFDHFHQNTSTLHFSVGFDRHYSFYQVHWFSVPLSSPEQPPDTVA